MGELEGVLVSDTYDDAIKLLRELNPFVQPKTGQRVAIVAAYLSPSDEHRQNLELRQLVDLYRLEHIRGCDCELCERVNALFGRKLDRRIMLPLDSLEGEHVT